MCTTIPFKSPHFLELPTACALSLLAMFAVILYEVPAFAAQTSAVDAAAAPVHKQLHPHERLSTVHTQVAVPQATFAPVTPPALEPPQWPVNEKPSQASVLWDSHELRIDARNSSLQQILQDVAATTGAKVEGMGADQRIFGIYGPGQARDVLSQLLEGSGYNVIMIGDQGQGTPRQIVLSIRPAGVAPRVTKNVPANVHDEDTDNDEPPIPSESNPSTPPRTPQQLLQEIQQRRQAQQQPAPAP